jgi:hypothetical protein
LATALDLRDAVLGERDVGDLRERAQCVREQQGIKPVVGIWAASSSNCPRVYRPPVIAASTSRKSRGSARPNSTQTLFAGTPGPSEDDVKDAIRVAREVSDAAGTILESEILSPW